ncbi:CidA/LrgA family protein [Aquitalea aquatica]|uniref:CidA/LrgA family protein n=1 Tax=Aquitalea aquatica TaxID=3044273 RepID=A0A838Y110_9NEIS|nr:CidA/LrgA family protein [Aquitalea magnusonii]MBA4708843.1 CidA/LrgA family protein [Aquitalea magnusonii]
MKNLPNIAVKQSLSTLLQVVLLSLVWLLASRLSHSFLPAVPAGVLGMFLVLAALALGWLPLAWCKSGARWLLAEMLLFFIPATVAVVQYPQLMGSIGLRIVLVILLSTVLVMTVTSLVVDAGYKFEILLKRRKRQHGVS